MVWKNYQNVVEKQSKREKWRLGVVLGTLGELLEAFWPQDGPKLKKELVFFIFLTSPGSQLGSQNWTKQSPGPMFFYVFFGVCF